MSRAPLQAAALALLLGGCCATNGLWRAVDDTPTALHEARISDAGLLSAAVEYEDGETWLVEADLRSPSRTWTSAEAERLREIDGPLPEDAGRFVEVRWLRYVGKTSDASDSLWIDDRGYRVIVDCPAVIDWSAPPAWLAVAATPVTLGVDVAMSPVHLVWTLATVGGHGDPWVPWCGE